MLGDIHYAAAALDPTLYEQRYWEDPKVSRGLDAAIERALMVYDSAEERREKYIAIARQLEIYKSKSGVFAYGTTFMTAEAISAHGWWNKYKAETPDLAWVGERVTGQVSSSSASERGHKAARGVRSKKRNRMDPIKMDKETFVHEALRTQEKVTDLESGAHVLQLWTAMSSSER